MSPSLQDPRKPLKGKFAQNELHGNYEKIAVICGAPEPKSISYRFAQYLVLYDLSTFNCPIFSLT